MSLVAGGGETRQLGAGHGDRFSKPAMAFGMSIDAADRLMSRIEVSASRMQPADGASRIANIGAHVPGLGPAVRYVLMSVRMSPGLPRTHAHLPLQSSGSGGR
jgi:hypothetical protein